MFRKFNIVFVGIALLLVFAGALWLVESRIDHTVNEMHSVTLKESGRYRAELIDIDFKRIEELEKSVRVFLQEDRKEGQFIDFLSVLVRMDPKLCHGWCRKKDGEEVVCLDSLGHRISDLQLESALRNLSDSLLENPESGLYRAGGQVYWTLTGQTEKLVYGFDVSLMALHAYFADMSPNIRTYAYIVNEAGVLIAHPDENVIGKCLEDTALIRGVIAGNVEKQVEAFSDYLFLSVERVYYPIQVGNENWVVAVNIPQLLNQEEMANFHRYTMWIAIVTLLIFTILLVFSQYKWRKEYELRRRVEQEATELSLLQLRNQLNPHFLFNSLNSLSALIRTDPDIAKKFVLELSKVYRYVLEKRNDNLSSVRDELEFTRHYYFLQKIRFGDQLCMEIEEKAMQERRKIPAMSLQLMVENAIKHNEITAQYPLSVKIYISDENLIVENTYRPRNDVKKDSWGVGLENIRRIYELFTNQQFSCRCEAEKFICLLPLI